MLSFKQAIITCVREKPLNIKDRAPRSEFWWFMLALFIVGIIANILALIPVLGLIIYIVYSIASLVLTITVSVRRLHDRNMRGWWLVAPYVVVFLGVIVAVAGGITGLVLSFSGYVPNATQSAETLSTIFLFVALVPVVGDIVRIILLKMYKFNEAEHAEVVAKINRGEFDITHKI